MVDEYIRLDTTIIAIDNLINEAATGTMARTLFKAKDTIYNQQRYIIDVQSVNQWISVKDRLPKEWYEVLVYSEMGKIEQAIYVNGRWKLSAFLGEIVDVTHWQPLPKPPKDGEQNDT